VEDETAPAGAEIFHDAKTTLRKNGNEMDRAKLREQLFSGYDKMNIPDDVKVKFGLEILNADIVS